MHQHDNKNKNSHSQRRRAQQHIIDDPRPLRIPKDTFMHIFSYLAFNETLICALVSKSFHRVATCPYLYFRDGEACERIVQKRVSRFYSQSDNAIVPCRGLELPAVLPRLLWWYCTRSLEWSTERGLKPRESVVGSVAASNTTLHNREEMVVWAREVNTLLEVHGDADRAQRGVQQQCILHGFLQWQLFCLLPLLRDAGVPAKPYLAHGYTLIWVGSLIQMCLLISMFNCVATRHVTILSLSQSLASAGRHYALEMVELAQSTAAVVFSCLFLRVFEIVTVDGTQALGYHYWATYAVITVAGVFGGCVHVARSFPLITYAVGSAAVFACLALPSCLSQPSSSLTLGWRIVTAFGFTPLNAFIIVVLVSSLKMGVVGGGGGGGGSAPSQVSNGNNNIILPPTVSAMSWLSYHPLSLIAIEGTKVVAYVLGISSLALVCHGLSFAMIFFHGAMKWVF
eukprot:PhM_4_TR13916/c2_g2_i1/m.39945